MQIIPVHSWVGGISEACNYRSYANSLFLRFP
ncbi:unnamed protein product [Gulo gulo]|uniref:Uncharacterized protein n=1 Tax=Gulo gulo TaxID=48420 RepID=A0A9X9PV66_GULGU|nr:unnamed protein product [Gulo gulo]